jgi:hypothetical protein
MEDVKWKTEDRKIFSIQGHSSIQSFCKQNYNTESDTVYYIDEWKK